MLEDVKLAVNGKLPVHFFGRMGGMTPSVEQLVEKLLEFGKQPVKL